MTCAPSCVALTVFPAIQSTPSTTGFCDRGVVYQLRISECHSLPLSVHITSFVYAWGFSKSSNISNEREVQDERERSARSFLAPLSRHCRERLGVLGDVRRGPHAHGRHPALENLWRHRPILNASLKKMSRKVTAAGRCSQGPGAGLAEDGCALQRRRRTELGFTACQDAFHIRAVF